MHRIESGDGGLEVVVYPDTAHGIVDGGIYHHRLLVRVNACNLLIHLEEVAVTGCNDILSESLDSRGEIEEHCESCLIHTISGITSFLSGAGCHVTGNEVTECGISALEIVVT